MSREAMSNSFIWSMVNGESIRIRKDKWIALGVIGAPANRNDHLVVIELINKNNSTLG